MKRRKQNILKRAIQSLPTFRLRKENCWNEIENRLEEGRSEAPLRRALDKLTVHVAPGDLWQDIEHRLEQKEANLQRAVRELPAFKVSSDLWERIEGKIGVPRGRTIKLKRKTICRIAASILVLLSVSGLLYRFFILKTDSAITTHTEIINRNDNLDLKPGADEMQPFLNSQLCRGNPQICSSPRFKELDRQLKDLQERIDRIIRQPGSKNDPQLLKYYYRLENEKAEVEKQMIKLIIQT